MTGIASCVRLMTEGGPGRFRAGVFLAYVGAVAGASALLGVRALRTKARSEASRSAIDLAPPLLLVGGGVALAAFGVAHGKILYVLFATLGAMLGTGQLRFWLRPPVLREAVRAREGACPAGRLPEGSRGTGAMIRGDEADVAEVRGQ